MRKNLLQLFISVMAWMSCMDIQAQNPLKLTYKIGEAETVTTEEQVAGKLTMLLGGHEQAMTVTELSVEGYLNGEDLKELRLMAGGNDEATNCEDGALRVIDLSKAHFSETEGTLPKEQFMVCGRLEHVILPQDLTEVGVDAFKNCINLKSLTFAGDLERTTPELCIAENAFEGCAKMEFSDGKLPNRIVNIANRAFKDTGITQLVLPTNEKLTGIASENVGNIGYAAFMGCAKLEKLTIPANVTTFNGVVFQNCTNLVSILFEKPENITTIAEHAFCNTPKLGNQFAGKLTNVITIGEGAFQNCSKITDADVATLLSKVTRIEPNTFYNCPEITEINLPSSINYIGKSAFAIDVNLRKIVVNRASQIEAVWYEGTDNIFNGVNPNKVQVVFDGNAETYYQHYRTDIVKDGENIGKNAFMYLLTKTLDENEADYAVVPQRHANVKLKRTFKAGWNTLVLPFGASANYSDKETKCSRIFQKALNGTNDDNFMIATYRGLCRDDEKPEKGTFYFLQYSNYDTDPLDEFEPLLIKMSQADIDASQGVYTFENVELNYDWNTEQEYTAEQAKERMGKKEDGSYFDGNYNHDLNDKFGRCSYDDFYFTGTLCLQQGEATEGSLFIAPGDYIIQNNTFVECKLGKKYGVKGFHGYFKQKPSAAHAAKTEIDICVVDGLGGTTKINALDGKPVKGSSGLICNLKGQLVGLDATLLPKGIYILDGKKFVVK